MKKVVLTVSILLSLVGLFFIFQNNGSSNAGEIVVLVKNGDTIMSEETIFFEEGDTLFDVMEDNYELVCADMSYNPTNECKDLLFGSPVILGIDGLETNWSDNYFAISVNEEYSTLGVDLIVLEDGDIVEFAARNVGGE